jgi:spore coat protein U-like protein
MRKLIRAVGYIAILAAVGIAGPAGAVTATGSLGVTIIITKTCAVGTSTPVDFGSQGLLTTNFDAAGAISVNCTTGTTYDVGLSAGAGSGATVTNRKMTGPASATVTYQLYRDSLRTLNWGNTVPTDTQAGIGTGLAQSISVYGRVATQTTPAPGTYNDTVTVTVTY